MGTSVVGGDPFGPLAERYTEGLVSQGIGAEIIAGRWKLDRAQLDEYSARSHQRAAAAAAAGGVPDEIIPGAGTAEDGTVRQHTVDETVRAGTTVEGLSGLKPAFYDESLGRRFPEIGWSITAGNSSPLTDGASAALIMSEDKARSLGLRPRARFHAFA